MFKFFLRFDLFWLVFRLFRVPYFFIFVNVKMCLAFKTLNGLEFCYKFLSTLICVAGADMKTVTLQTMVIWPLPMTLRGYTLGDCLAEYLADENIKDWECFKCAHGEAVMKKTVVSWPRFVYPF
jgi:ubiquitin C-terminal hydrolase